MPRTVNIPGPPPRIPLTLREIVSSAGGLFVLRFDPLPMTWEPGDCIAVYAPDSSISRPYSMSGGVGDPWTELLVRRIEGGHVSQWLTSLTPGSTIDVSPPFGWFRPAEPPEVPKLYLATGSGIAPFWSAIRSQPHTPVKVLWGLRHEKEIQNESLFEDLEIWISREAETVYQTGRITDALSSLSLEEGLHVYACGLDRMIEESFGLLRSRGLPENCFHRECFFTAVQDGGLA